MYDLGDRLLHGRQRPHLGLRRGDGRADPRQGDRPDGAVGLLVRAAPATSSRTTCSPPTWPRRCPTSRAPAAELDGRSMLVRKAQRVDIECVVRGYLAGSGWAEYRRTGTLAGEHAPGGPGRVRPPARAASSRPPPRPTPATTRTSRSPRWPTSVGEELTAADRRRQPEALRARGGVWARRAASSSPTRSSSSASSTASSILIDEVLTPDSSRFWPADQYQPGGAQPSFDKQYLRDYLETTGWNKEPPPPALPDDVVARPPTNTARPTSASPTAKHALDKGAAR